MALCIAPAEMTEPSPSPRLPLARSIVLVGLMGVGKSTIGKRLSQQLNVPFFDADAEIEIAAGLTIAEIFERFGEAHFRDGERRVIARLIGGTPKIIATGGGAFMNESTRTLILGETTAIWIDADVATLAERVRRRDTRPLLKDRDAYQVLSELAAVRNPIYALAPIHIKSQDSPHDETVSSILQALKFLREDS
jgi:shikimate kinase